MALRCGGWRWAMQQLTPKSTLASWETTGRHTSGGCCVGWVDVSVGREGGRQAGRLLLDGCLLAADWLPLSPPLKASQLYSNSSLHHAFPVQRHGAGGHTGGRAHAARAGRPLWVPHKHRHIRRLHVVGSAALPPFWLCAGCVTSQLQLRLRPAAAGSAPRPSSFLQLAACVASLASLASLAPAAPSRPLQVPALLACGDAHAEGGDAGIPGSQHLDATQAAERDDLAAPQPHQQQRGAAGAGDAAQDAAAADAARGRAAVTSAPPACAVLLAAPARRLSFGFCGCFSPVL